MPSKEHLESNNPVYQSIMRGLREAAAYEQGENNKGVSDRADVCLVCYEENGPAPAERIMNTENSGVVDALSVMDSVDAAVSWVTSRMIDGFQNGYRREDPNMTFDRAAVYGTLLKKTAVRIRMENKDDCEGGDWYDIIVVPRIVNKEYE